MAQDERAELDDLFDQFDNSKGQTIEYEELHVMMRYYRENVCVYTMNVCQSEYSPLHRRYGQNPSDKVLKEMIAEISTEPSGNRVTMDVITSC